MTSNQNHTVSSEHFLNQLMEFEESLDTSWILNTTFLIFFMQAGFSMLEAGSVRAKNTKNILLKNVVDVAVGAVFFWSFGYAFALGSGNDFIGHSCFFLIDCEEEYPRFVFQWAFSATAATIVSGPLAERSQFTSYIFHSSFVTAFIYPVVAHWCWSSDGWLNELHYIDFAGASVVHVLGGLFGLCGSYIVGPRIGRFANQDENIPGHSVSLSVLGTFILWYGWYGFNCGSTLGLNPPLYQVSARVAVNTTLCACVSGVTSLLIERSLTGTYETNKTINGVLSGLAVSTAGCSVNEPWSYLIIGFVSGAGYLVMSRVLIKLRIDDPLDAVPVHFTSGLWGVLSTSAFAKEEYVHQVYGDDAHFGFLHGGGFQLLGIQLLGLVSICAWTAIWGLLLFKTLHFFNLLRVSYDVELAGLDNTKHVGPAYPEFT